MLTRLDADDADLRRDRAGATADDEHDPEGSTLSAEWQRLEALRAATAAELGEVRSALERVVDGTYGVCQGCGIDIPPTRLEVRPHAATCIECAQTE